MKRYHPEDTLSLYAGIALSSATVFVADLYTPLGVAVWVFYLAPLFTTLLSWRPATPLVTAATQTALAIAGFVLSPPGVATDVARANRTIGVITVWLVASGAFYFIRGKLAVRRQEWLQEGQARMVRAMAGEQSLAQLGDNLLKCAAEYLDAKAAAIFVQDNGTYCLTATYGVRPDSGILQRFAPGESLLGQAAKDCRSFVVSNVDEGYVPIGSGLGQQRPRHLLIAPAVVDGTTNAVVEFAFTEKVDSASEELLSRASNAIAMTVRSVKFRVQLQELLEETQRQAEELQAQSEELRASNDELEQQSKALQESQVRLEEQQAELEATNSTLQEQAQLLETQRDELISAKSSVEAQAQELERASEYKSQFLASMSHELRTPLNSALILARLLWENREGNLTAEQVGWARSIESSGNALLQLINDVLDLAKVEAGRMEIRAQHVPLSRVADMLRSTFEPLASHKGLALEIRMAATVPPSIETDAQRLEQVLNNLLANAIKFTEKGEVRLEVNRRGDGRIAFEVHDTGIGIPEEHLRAIFEPFRQGEASLSRKYGGTGLGLSISRELVRLMGGEIQVQSVEGQGSCFTVVIPERYDAARVSPRMERRAEVASAAAGSGASVASRDVSSRTLGPQIIDDRETLGSGERIILIVEDDELFAHILRDLAHELGFRCLLATTAGEAMTLAVQYAVCGVVLDVGLPDNSGLSLLDRLKLDTRTRHVPVHMVSVHDYAETALSLGAVGYVLKPVKREQLVDAFRRLEDRLARRLRRVLVVEDDEVQREALTKLLSCPDVAIDAVSSAAECLQMLQTSSFDCMVLDLSLPDASGMSLLDTISREERYSFPPVIVYTARELDANEEQALRRYSQSIIIKGAKSPERLLDEVTLFLHQVVSELPPDKQRMLAKARSRDALLEGRSILLVEDDVRNIFALTSVLETRGVKVRIARNGREALEALEQESGGIDLVLMDIMMPEMDGLKATREIRKRPAWKKLPIIALTAKAMKGDQEQAIAAGANDYMAKPLDVDQLLSAVRVWMPR